MNDRQQALLDAARCLPFADHVGDVVSSMALLWMSAGLGEIPADEASGEIDDDELERMGGRRCHEVHHGLGAQTLKLFEMLDSMAQRWPYEANGGDCDDIAGILGVELWTRRGRHSSDPSEMRIRQAPAPLLRGPIGHRLPEGLKSILVGDTTGWKKVGE